MAASERRRIRIVVADDHQIFREGLRSLIEGQTELEVVAEAADGRAAVEAARRLRPDVVVMDIGLPGLNGVDATRRIRAECVDTTVIALSMHSEQSFVVAMLDAGAAAYLRKDCSYQELLATIRAAAGRPADSVPLALGLEARRGRLARPGTEAGPFRRLTRREREVLQLLAEGRSTVQIAERLGMSGKTVATHRQHVMDKLGIRSVAGLTRYALREGLTVLGDDARPDLGE